LCKVCHDFVTGKEELFVTLFNHVLKGNLKHDFINNWTKNFTDVQKRWMQKEGILSHLRNNQGLLPGQAGIIKMSTTAVPKGIRRIKLWKRRSAQ
jgi:hypothetical protein